MTPATIAPTNRRADSTVNRPAPEAGSEAEVEVGRAVVAVRVDDEGLEEAEEEDDLALDVVPELDADEEAEEAEEEDVVDVLETLDTVDWIVKRGE